MQRLLSIIKRRCNPLMAAEFEHVAKSVALYQIDRPITLLASDYGVPQNRIRVVFIGSRNEPELTALVKEEVVPSSTR